MARSGPVRQHEAMSTDSEVRRIIIELLGTGAMRREHLLAAVRAHEASTGEMAERILRQDFAFSSLGDHGGDGDGDGEWILMEDAPSMRNAIVATVQLDAADGVRRIQPLAVARPPRTG